MIVTFLAISIGDSATAESPAIRFEDSLAFSANNDLELLEEEETVSIASRYEQPISQAPANVYVITDEEIRQSGAIDLPTVRRRIPGLEVMQMTGADFSVSARDSHPFANKMLVMVDGRSIYLDVQGNVFWKSFPPTLLESKRIAVLKGPASAMYGFNAFDGALNIISKSPEEMKGTALQFGGGEQGTISSAAVHAGTDGKLGYRPAVERQRRCPSEMGQRPQRRNELQPRRRRHLSDCTKFHPIGNYSVNRGHSAWQSGRQRQPAEPARRVSALAEGRRRVHARCGGGALCPQCAQRRTRGHPLGDLVGRRVIGWLTLRF